jgi:hypothetical protein
MSEIVNLIDRVHTNVALLGTLAPAGNDPQASGCTIRRREPAEYDRQFAQ